MKPSEIQVGRTYRNRGKGRTTRIVLEISTALQVYPYSDCERAGELVVRYFQAGREANLYLDSFAAWAGSEVVLVPE
jgi:hypothetical protein